MLDEIFGRNNYLSTFYIQVRYPNKTLAEDSDYQKVIEQIHIYSKNKSKAKLNRPQAEYDISKFKWEIEETAPGTTIELGGKTVTIFKPGEYSIKEVEPHLDGLKETWATGSLTRVKASAGEFFELHLAARKEIDGLGCLYKVSNIGEDGLGYRYISGPKKVTANKGKFYSGIPLKRKEELKEGKSYKYLPVTNFYDFSGSFGNCRLEGGVGFKGGKKPESLLKMIFQYFSNPGDLILDSFLGSGTSAAVALKMGRRFIGVELGEHCYSLCLPRLNRVIDGDKTGISKELNWTGGGGFKFFELAPSLVTKDEFGNSIIDQRYNPDMLAAAISLLNGYTYAPDPDVFWKQGYSTERSYIYTTTNFITREIADTLYDAVPEEINLLVCTSAFEQGLNDSYPNITFRKIPQSVLNKCTYGDVSYALPVIEREDFSEEEETFDD